MDKLELKHCVAHYLPYNILVQYEGIINGSEISSYEKEYQKNHEDDNCQFFFEHDYDPPKIKIGLKTGYIKIAEYWNNGVIYRVGRKKYGLKAFYNAEEFKLILRPLSDLTNDLLELFYKTKSATKIIVSDYIEKGSDRITLTVTYTQMGETFTDIIISRGNVDYTDFWIVQNLLSLHFDVFGLIEKELAIDINTIQ